MRRFVVGLSALFLIGVCAPSFAQTKVPPVSYNVGVCDPRFNQNCVAPNSDGSINAKITGGSGASTITTPSGVTSTDASFTVTLGGTYQTVLAASATRKGCTFQNPSTATEAVTFKFATQATAYTLTPGQTISCDLPNGQVEQSAITATAPTTSHAVAGNSQ